jgi:HSP20 family protein
MMNMNRQADRFLNAFLAPAGEACRNPGHWNPATDIYENDDAYVIKAELPGLDKDHVSIDVKEKILTISGERSEENEVKDDRIYRRERFQGKFQRAFSLPNTADADKIEAEFVDGLLTITIPKAKELKPKQITIH